MKERLVRPMHLENLPAVMEIDRQCLPAPWSGTTWREEVRSPFSLYLVLVEGDVVAAQPRARRVYLEVRPSNLAARALYDSLGFVQTGVRPGYYGDEDALLLTLDLDAQRRVSQAR